VETKPEAPVAAPVAAPAPAPKKEIAEAPAEIQYEDFAKVKLRVGKILSAEKHPKANRLLILQVDIGEEKPRQILAGIAEKYTAEQVLGRTIIVVANLAPRKMMGMESQGMLLAASLDDALSLVTADIGAGASVK
jgi:methionyl-tRNA synthetase